MSQSVKYFWQGGTTCIWVLCLNVAGAQDLNRNGPEFEDGALQLVTDQMQNLIKIKWNGRRLALSRDWPDPNAGKTEKERREARIRAMIDRGMDRATAERFAEQGQRNPFGSDDPLGIAFSALKAPVGAGSSGRSGSADNMRMTFHGNKLSGLAAVSEERIRFEFEENQAPGRRISITDTESGQVSLTYVGDDFLIDLRQKDDGHVRLARIANETAQVFVAKDFSTMTEEYPNEIGEWLIPVMRHVGMTVPVLKNNAQVRSAVVARLVAMQADASTRLQQLLMELDSDSFEERDNATKALTGGFDIWADAIKNYFDTANSISPEARKRLSDVIKNGEGENEISTFITENKLMSSAEYLIGLLSDAAEKSAVTDRLEEITGQQLGNDPSAWKKWLDEQSDK